MYQKAYALLLILIISCMRLSAQPFVRHGSHYTQASADTLPRLIASRYDSLSPLVVGYDSSSYLYSGTRGGDDNSQINDQKYDLRVDVSRDSAMWGLHDRYTQTFDTNNNLLTQTCQYYIGGAWTNQHMYVNSYDTYNNLDTQTLYAWMSGAWAPQSRTILSYDQSGHCLQNTLQDHNTGSWQNSIQSNNEYDSFGNEIYTDYSTWDTTSQIYQYRDSFTYNAHNQEVSELDQTYSTGIWSRSELNIYTYDINGNQVATQIQYWSDTVWINGSLDSATYDTYHNRLSNTRYNWGGSSYTPLWRDLYAYNTSNLMLSDTTENWTGAYWQYSYLTTYGYNAASDQTFNQGLTYSGGNWGATDDIQNITTYNNYHQYLTNIQSLWNSDVFIPTFEYYYWYNDSAAQQPSAVAEIQTTPSIVYPNPFTKTFTVSFGATTAGTATLRLYDINGRLLTRTITAVGPGDNTITWDAGYSLPAGTYIYELTLGNSVSKGKIASQ